MSVIHSVPPAVALEQALANLIDTEGISGLKLKLADGHELDSFEVAEWLEMARDHVEGKDSRTPAFQKVCSVIENQTPS